MKLLLNFHFPLVLFPSLMPLYYSQVPRRYQEYITAANKQRLSASLLQLMRNGYSRATCSALSPPLPSTLQGYTAIFTIHIQVTSDIQLWYQWLENRHLSTYFQRIMVNQVSFKYLGLFPIAHKSWKNPQWGFKHEWIRHRYANTNGHLDEVIESQNH